MPLTITDRKEQSKVFSVPCHKEDKEFLLNESVRTGLSQKYLVKVAIERLRNQSPRLPNALPIKL